MKILSYKRFALWWQLAMKWFQRQFAAIAASIDFTPVEEKVDEVKSDVADVKTAVEHIDTSHLATETNATANKNAIIEAVNNAQPDLSSVAKQGTNANATLTAVLEALTDGGGELEPATDAEYAAFKSHMATEIDNILTPITEE